MMASFFALSAGKENPSAKTSWFVIDLPHIFGMMEM